MIISDTWSALQIWKPSDWKKGSAGYLHSVFESEGCHCSSFLYKGAGGIRTVGRRRSWWGQERLAESTHGNRLEIQCCTGGAIVDHTICVCMRLLCGWLHWCAQKGRRGILAGNANILICSIIATLNSVYLHDRLGRKVRLEGLREGWELGWVSKDWITVLGITARNQFCRVDNNIQRFRGELWTKQLHYKKSCIVPCQKHT